MRSIPGMISLFYCFLQMRTLRPRCPNSPSWHQIEPKFSALSNVTIAPEACCWLPMERVVSSSFYKERAQNVSKCSSKLGMVTKHVELIKSSQVHSKGQWEILPDFSINFVEILDNHHLWQIFVVFGSLSLQQAVSQEQHIKHRTQTSPFLLETAHKRTTENWLPGALQEAASTSGKGGQPHLTALETRVTE